MSGTDLALTAVIQVIKVYPRRVRRKIAHNTLHEGRMKTFHPLIRASVVELLDLLLSRPDEFAHHVH